MGSKTPGEEDQGQGESPNTNGLLAGGEPKGSHLSRDGDGCMGSGGGAESDDDDDDDDNNNATASTELKTPASGDTSKKKKRKKPKKKSKASGLKQSSPPRVPLDQLFPTGNYPEGEFLDHPHASAKTSRTGSSEVRYNERLLFEDSTFLNNYRKAAEVHRQTRKWVRESVQPGQTLTEIAAGIEDSVRALLSNPGSETGQCLISGMGFPTGLALNNCVAHYTPNPGFKDIVLQYGDVMKVDFGVHINGWIVDSAFTLAFDPVYDNLLAAVKDATNTGIRNAGIDVRISDVSAAIQETMESYEVEIRGKVYPVKPVRNLCGHDIKHYHIHGSKQIPFIKNSDQTKMEEGEIFAIETFGSTGRARITEDSGIYGYGLSDPAPTRVNLPLASANRLFKTIKDNFGSIVFCRRYLENLGCERYLAGLNSLVSNGILDAHRPLVDIPGSYSAQFEHTILLRESKKEVLSRGSDY